MTRKKKVLHLIQSLGMGGCEYMLLRTLPRLPDFEHTILTLKEPGELAPKFTTAGIAVETAHCEHMLSIAGIRRLRALVREQNPDIVITYLFHADFLGRLALGGVTQAPIIPFLRSTYNHPRYWIARLFARLTKRLIKRYLANSKAVKDYYVQHIGVAPEQVTVIPNGIDTDFFDQLIPDPKLRETLSITPEDFVITCVANLHPNKGHRYLLEAFESLWPKFPHAKLLIVGDGEERANLERQANDYRSKVNILFLGRRDDVPALLRISHLFVLPTLFEGQSNAILEAFAAGVPVITTDIPENRSVIKDSVTGLLVAKSDSSAIFDALQRLLTDVTLRRTLSQTAHETVRSQHNLSAIQDSWLAFLRIL